MIAGLSLVAVALASPNVSTNPGKTDVEAQYQRWETQLRARVADLHVVPKYALSAPRCDVTVAFAIDGNGRPANATVQQSSCSRLYDRQALRLIRQLGRLGQVPSASGKDFRVALKLSYGVEPNATADRQLAEVMASERQLHARRNLELATGVAR